MDPILKAKWIEALRSGKYKQGKGVLRYGDEFCCLGVLCDVVDPKKWESQFNDNPDSPHTFMWEDQRSLLPNSVQKLTGLDDKAYLSSDLEYGTGKNLVRMNA